MPIVVTPRGTRGVEWRRLPRPVMNAMFGLFHLSFAAFGRWMRIQGVQVLELETIGGRSGARRHSVLGSFPDAFAEPSPIGPNSRRSRLIVASNAGSARHPAWFLNIARRPDQVWMTIGGKRIKVTPETLEGAEREQAWQRISSMAPGYGRYQGTTDRVIPIIRLKAEEDQR